jgi:hypothetical protein
VAEDSNTAVEQSRRYGQMIAKAWTDPAFKARLLAEPAAVAREQGLDIPEGVPLRAIEIAPAETLVVLARSGAVAAEEPGPWASLLERAAANPAYKKRLLAEPVAALAEQGIDLPAGTHVRVIEPSDTEGYLFVPPIPNGLEIEAIGDDDTVGHSTCQATQKCDREIKTITSLRSQSALSRPVSLIGPGLVYDRGVFSAQIWVR